MPIQEENPIIELDSTLIFVFNPRTNLQYRKVESGKEYKKRAIDKAKEALNSNLKIWDKGNAYNALANLAENLRVF